MIPINKKKKKIFCEAFLMAVNIQNLGEKNKECSREWLVNTEPSRTCFTMASFGYQYTRQSF